jgi:ABC-type lipopolysaccharide export system ATPase subunit
VGEKKRTSIAYELISDPPVIMLDEPTSGLDSLTSYVIVKHLSDLARDRNKTVIMTIHQPNSEISTYSISSSSWSNNYSIYQLYEESTVDISYVLFFPSCNRSSSIGSMGSAQLFRNSSPSTMS